jgi:hypothetical protein
VVRCEERARGDGRVKKRLRLLKMASILAIGDFAHADRTSGEDLQRQRYTARSELIESPAHRNEGVVLHQYLLLSFRHTVARLWKEVQRVVRINVS